MSPNLCTASTDPEMATPSPSPLSYKTPHKSKMTPFKLFAQPGQPVSAMVEKMPNAHAHCAQLKAPDV